MNTVFLTALSLSFSGMLITLLLFLFKPLWRDRISKTWQYYIWLLVLLRLLLPFSPEANLMNSLFHQLEQTVVVSSGEPENLPGQPGSFSPNDIEKAAVTDYADAADTAYKVNTIVNGTGDTGAAANSGMADSLWIIWIAVAILLLVRKVTGYQSFTQYIRAGCTAVSDPTFLNLYSDLCEQTGVRYPPELSINPMIASPMLVGCRKSTIVLPADQFSEPELRCILLHELIHHRRLDFFVKWLTQITVCLHWFNPAVYLMSREMNRCCELSCDERIICRMDADGKRQYGSTLLAALKIDGSCKSPVAAVTLNEDARHIKERLESIMKFQSKSKLTKAATIVLTLILCLGAAVSGSYAYNSGSVLKKSPDAPTTVTSLSAHRHAGVNVSGKEENNKIYHLSNYYNKRSFFSDGYIVEMAWNVDISKYPLVRTIPVTATDGAITSYQIAFTDQVKSFADNQAVLKSVSQITSDLVLQQAAKQRWTNFQTPVITSVIGPYKETIDQLTQKFYQENDIQCFAAVIDKSSSEAKLQRAELTYKDKRIDFFSVIADELTAAERSQFLSKAYQDRRVDFFSMLMDELTDAERSQYLWKAYQDNRVDFFSMQFDELSYSDRIQYANRAYRDKRVDFFSIIMDELTPADRSSFAQRAYADNRIDFFSVLIDELSSQEREQYVRQAQKENRQDFSMMLSDN